MADIKDQLIKDSYNYVLQSDLSTGIVYRIGGAIPINPIFQSGLTINSGFTYSNGTEQPNYVLTTDGTGYAYWASVSGGNATGDYLPLSGGTVTGNTYFTSGLTANTLNVTGNTILNNTSGTSFYTNYIDFNNSLSPLPTDIEGRMYWDEDNGTVSLGMHGGQVIQQIGLEQYYYVKNQSGATIQNGRVVRASGTLGASGRILGEYMIANGTIPAKYTLGIATEDIVDGDDGYVTEFGLVRGINTTGSLYGETWTDGTILWVSPTIAGGLTKFEPQSPNLKIEIAIVIRANANGSIFVRPNRYPYMYDLQQVNYSAGTENNYDILQWSGNSWNKTNRPFFSGLTASTISATTYQNLPSSFQSVRINNTTQFSANTDNYINFSGVNITITSASTNTLVFSGTPSFSISGSNNQVLTSNGSGGTVAESLLTFDGTVSSPTLDVNSVCIGRGNGNDSSNISIGDVAFKLPVSLLDNNVSIGKSTLKNLSTGSNNIGIGTSSLEGCCISANFCDNIAIGRNSQKRRSGGVNNISLGNGSQYYSASGSNNISLGASTLIDNKASNNISLGVNSQRYNINGTKNISIGTNSMQTSCDGDSNIAIGYDSLRQNLNKSDFNIAIGQSSMYYNLSQYNDFNISIGRCALLCNNSGSGNIAIGRRTLAGSTGYGNRGSYNIAMGRGSMYLNDYGSFNIAIGRSSLYSNDNGSKNVSVGFRSTVNSTRASYLISIGYKSLYYNTSGANNISIGYKSLYYNTTGSNNIAIGCNTNSNNFRSSIIIGHNAYATAGNQLVIGSSSFPAGTITYESCTSYRTWEIIINGNSYKVLLA